MLRTAPVTLAVFMFFGGSATADDGAFFRQQVAPIFERHCIGCHGSVKPKGGLVLVDQNRAAAGGESGTVIESGKPDESLLFQYISGEKPEMPKDAAPLSTDQVAAVRHWIAEGANWPEGLTLADTKAIDGAWWSLVPLAKVDVPKVDSPWVRTPVDAFILAKLLEQHLTPSAEADRRTLVRRLTYDLHGLPPTPEEIDAFLADASGDAYAKLVDRLLASPRYGERWGRYWLDVVHFGESHGYDKDKPRPNAWPYRDYVIRSLNQDKLYDRFVEEQIAGDVLYPSDPQATVATGFIAAGPWDFVGHVELREGTVDKDIARSNDRDDMVANTMSTFISLTVHCARCHNHKFDPIRQEDYYGLQAVFAGVDRADRPYDVDPQVAMERKQLAAERAQLDARIEHLRQGASELTSEEIAGVERDLKDVDRRISALPNPQMVYAAASQFASQSSFTSPRAPRSIHLLARGDVRSPRQLVAAAAVACVRGPEAQFVLAEENQESERRAALARWLGDSRNALVRRSIVNRVWHYHLGQGIVDTPNDFGRMGSLPTHPELLEWPAG
jgi:mono/diheme cytochrome c family protein